MTELRERIPVEEFQLPPEVRWKNEQARRSYKYFYGEPCFVCGRTVREDQTTRSWFVHLHTGGYIVRTDEVPSYRAALVYHPVRNASLYADYGTSFNPSAESLTQITSARGLGIGNADLAPEENRTYELGVKWDVLNDGLTLSGSLFRLEKTNARLPDPTRPGFNILAGEQRVQGVQLGAVGRLNEDWQISLGYTYLNGRVTKSETGAAPVGSLLPNTPEHSFTFFTEYRLGGGFEIGGGAQFVASRLAQNLAPLKTVPSYWTVDLMGKYEINERTSLQINVTNVLDAYFYEGLHPFHVVPGAGRVALLTLNYSY